MSTKANWRSITVGSYVWLPSVDDWLPGIVYSVGRNLKERTKIGVAVDGIKGYTVAAEVRVSQLYDRKPALNGADKPVEVTA